MCKESKIHFFTNPPYSNTFLKDWVEQINNLTSHDPVFFLALITVISFIFL